MDTDEEVVQATTPFQLQFDKPIAAQIKIAEWNPEKDLLAMVTMDFKILLHRFNWQRLWTVSPGRCITSLRWRPDGKAIAVGLEDGTISLHDVEYGKLLRSIKSHSVAVVCLHWQEVGQPVEKGKEKGLKRLRLEFFSVCSLTCVMKVETASLTKTVLCASFLLLQEFLEYLVWFPEILG